jgi:hypothetical protein
MGSNVSNSKQCCVLYVDASNMLISVYPNAMLSPNKAEIDTAGEALKLMQERSETLSKLTVTDNDRKLLAQAFVETRLWPH